MNAPTDFIALCNAWKVGETSFAAVLTCGLNTLGMPLRELAVRFEVAESTVSRWASGIARPHPRIQALVVAHLKKRATGARVSVPPTNRQPVGATVQDAGEVQGAEILLAN